MLAAVGLEPNSALTQLFLVPPLRHQQDAVIRCFGKRIQQSPQLIHVRRQIDHKLELVIVFGNQLPQHLWAITLPFVPPTPMRMRLPLPVRYWPAWG